MIEEKKATIEESINEPMNKPINESAISKRYYMLNKPQGYITARHDANRPTIMDLMPEKFRYEIFPVGRLDKDTQGLLLLTNDGKFNERLMHPQHHVSKTYVFYAFGDINAAKSQMLESGLHLKGEEKKTKAAKFTILGQGTYRDYQDEITLHKRLRKNESNLNQPAFKGQLSISEGRKHQVKRMLLAIGCKIVFLQRIAIGTLQLDASLAPGEWKILSTKDMEAINKSL